MPKLDHEVSTAEAARLIGVARQRVDQLIARGVLRARYDDADRTRAGQLRKYLVRSEVEDYAAHRAKQRAESVNLARDWGLG